MKIFPTSDIKEIDRYTIAHEPTKSIDLMERASLAATDAIVARWDIHHPVKVYAGAGNNGGDGLAIARLLHQRGYDVEVFLFNPRHNLSDDCQINLDRLRDIGINIHENVDRFALPPLTSNTLLIDAIFGSGLSRPLDNTYSDIIQYINSSGAIIISIDIPSGMLGEDNGACNLSHIVQPTLTLTFQFPKLSFLTAEEHALTGEWTILDIGLHPDVVKSTYTPYNYTLPQEVATRLKNRALFSQKYDYGHLLIVAGSRGMMGAAILATRAALHSGVGVVTLHTAGCGESIVQTAVPEAIVSTDIHAEHISLVSLERSYSAVAIGPGMGSHIDSRNALKELLSSSPCPMVIDADALNILSEDKNLIGHLQPETILTPHHREFDRLFGASDTQYIRIQKAREICREYNIIIVLKGAYTAVILPSGDVHFNSTGNPGMATAGSGDTLTGIIGALLAGGSPPIDAATIGVMLHGLAGDLAIEKHSPEYITASDIINHIGKAFKQLRVYNR